MSVVLDANALVVLSQPKDTAAVVAMAQRLERRSAYDAAYLVLAEELHTQLWTLDGRLARSTERLKLSTQLTQAEGEDQSRGFLVLENSMGRREKMVMQRGYEQLRDTLIHEGTLVEEGDRIRLVRSYLFDSPSAAASVLAGGNKNGRTEWKNTAGRTLKELQEQAAPTTDSADLLAE